MLNTTMPSSASQKPGMEAKHSGQNGDRIIQCGLLLDGRDDAEGDAQKDRHTDAEHAQADRHHTRSAIEVVTARLVM